MPGPPASMGAGRLWKGVASGPFSTTFIPAHCKEKTRCAPVEEG